MNYVVGREQKRCEYGCCSAADFKVNRKLTRNFHGTSFHLEAFVAQVMTMIKSSYEGMDITDWDI
jgi:hypothetical protein